MRNAHSCWLLSGVLFGTTLLAAQNTGPITSGAEAIARARGIIARLDEASKTPTQGNLTATQEGDIWTVQSPPVCPIETIPCASATIVKFSAKDGSVLYMKHDGPPPVPGLGSDK